MGDEEVENLMYMPRKRYEKLPQALLHLPEELTQVRVRCTNARCANWFTPNWLEKIPPLTPVRPNEGTGMWVCVQTHVKCPNCGTNVPLDLPVAEQKARYSFFGDEAFRETSEPANLQLVTYTLVGTNTVRLPEVEKAIQQFKRELHPALPPESWRLHMTDIWPEHKRKKHPLFRAWTQEDVGQFALQFFDVITGFDEAFIIYNFVGIYHKLENKRQRRLAQDEARNRVYSALLMEVIDDATRNGIQPNFFFDSQKPSDGGNVIHGWAKDAFYGSHINLLFAFLSRGLDIPEPTFVSPGSRPCLEVADFVSYVVARYCYRKLHNRPIELDPVKLGPVKYGAFLANGDIQWHHQAGYPWNDFFEEATRS